MFSLKDIKANLLGCLEISLFMRHGIERYDNSRVAAIRSFLIPLLLMPVALYVTAALDDSGGPYTGLIVLHGFKLVIAIVLFLTIVYFIAKQYDRQEHFNRFVSISNWSSIPAMLLVAPILYLVLTGQDTIPLESYAVFITLLGYVYSAFIITHCFKMPWQLGGFIAILGMAIDQNLWSLTNYMHGLIS